MENNGTRTTVELAKVERGYSASEWLEVIAVSAGLESRTTLAVERLVMARETERQARVQRARAERLEAERLNALVQSELEAARGSHPYAVIRVLMGELTNYGVTFALKAGKVTVNRVDHVKAEGDAETPIVWFTSDGIGVRAMIDGVTLKPQHFTLAELCSILKATLPARTSVAMPSKLRDVMKTHRAKNRDVVDPTGEDASEWVDTVAVIRPKMRKAGDGESRQGKRGFDKMTHDERRAADRARLKAWREAKRAEKLAAQSAS